MRRKFHIFAVILLILVPSRLLRANDLEPPEPGDVEQPLLEPAETVDEFVNRDWYDEEALCGDCETSCAPELAARFGWWVVDTDGDLTKIGEYQDLESSPFWDVDGLITDGYKTYDFHATGTDNEATDAGLYFYRPGFSADLNYERYLRRRDHDPLNNFPQFPNPVGQFVAEDLNVGEDYAIRVQEFKTNFKGDLTSNVKWRLNVWGMRKSGERQANAMSHCFDHPAIPGGARFCHVLSQRQRIDWVTTEIEPVLSTRIGRFNVEYSRPMRWFSQDDQAVTRLYNPFGGGVNQITGQLPYAFVPENYTEIDRLKIGIDLSECRDFYARTFTGNTHNKFRETDRRFYGFDLRLTDRSIDGLTLAGYAKQFRERNQGPPFLIGFEQQGVDIGQLRIRHPVDYRKTTAGLRGRWKPFWDSCSPSRGLSLTGGYEYRNLDRQFAEFETENTPGGGGPTTFDQSHTITHLVTAGAKMRWSACLDNYVRFRTAYIRDPLFGVRETSGDVNTSLPTHEDIVEFGGTWTPTHNFFLSATIGLETRNHNTEIASFVEDTYPITVSVWYAPSCKWSLTAGYAIYSNWIDQDITLGDEYPLAPGDPEIPAVTRRWSYGGRSEVVSLGANYAHTQYLSFIGGLEFVRARNAIDAPVFDAPFQWPEIAVVSDVLVETVRASAGFDYLLNDAMTCYCRYNYFDYEDKSEDYNTGTAHMFLTGVSAIY